MLPPQAQARNRSVLQHMVERISLRLMRSALEAWRAAAHERRVRRTSIARFIQRWDAARKTTALAHWRQARGGGAWRVRACSVCGSGGAVQGGWAECAPELPARVHASQASP